MLARLDNYDWEEAFGYAGRFREVLGDDAPKVGYTREDVVAILATAEGENDGDSWEGVFLLADGRFAFLSAWCDYTGWDCQAGGVSCVAYSLVQLIRFGLDKPARFRFGCTLVEDAPTDETRFRQDDRRRANDFLSDLSSGKVDLTTGSPR